MTEADRLQKMLARAEAEVSRLKDLLKDWEGWEHSMEIQGFPIASEDGLNYELADLYRNLQTKRNEALKR